MIVRNGRKIGHGGIDLGPDDDAKPTASMSEAPRTYATIREVPTDLLARNFVGSLILAKGNIAKWDELAKLLIRELRGEPTPISPEEEARDPRRVALLT